MAKREKYKGADLPEIDGAPKIGQHYYCINSTNKDGSQVTKSEMKEKYKSRFGEDPAFIFYAAPNGTLIMAGPIRGK